MLLATNFSLYCKLIVIIFLQEFNTYAVN